MRGISIRIVNKRISYSMEDLAVRLSVKLFPASAQILPYIH